MDGSFAWTVPEITGTWRQYPKPPIIEAILELEVEFAQPLEASEIERAVGDESDPIPIHEFDVSDDWEGDTTTTARTVVGFSFKSREGDLDALVRYRVDRFSFSQLSSYTSWDQFVASAEAAWERYKKLFQPVKVTAVGVRFVNRIDVGRERFDVSDYLRTGVQISPYLSQIVLSFFAQVQIPMKDEDSVATITTAPDRSLGQTSVTALILDIDVTKRLDLSTSDPAFQSEFQGLLAILDRRAIEVFEACITDATRNLIS